MSEHPGDPFCGDDPHLALAYGLPENPFDPSPLPALCPPMPYGALGEALALEPASVAEAAALLHTAGTGLHWVADNGRAALAPFAADLGATGAPLQEGFDQALDAVRRLGDDVGRLGDALAQVLRAYAELDESSTAPVAAGRAV